MCYYLELGFASEWMKICFNLSEAHDPDHVVTYHLYVIYGETVGGVLQFWMNWTAFDYIHTKVNVVQSICNFMDDQKITCCGLKWILVGTGSNHKMFIYLVVPLQKTCSGSINL